MTVADGKHARRVYGTGSIYYDEQRARWVGRAPLPPGPGGKRRRTPPVYGDTAKQVAAKLDAARRRAQPVTTSGTLRQFLVWYCDHHLAELVARDELRPGTVTSNRQNLVGHVSNAIGHVRLARLGPEDMTALLAYLGQANLAPATRKLVYVQLRQALTVAERFGRVDRNWAQIVPAPRTTRPHRDTPDVDQARRILDAAVGDRLAPLLTVTLAMGMRVSETLGVSWSDLDTTCGRVTLTVRHQLERRDGRWQLVAPKGRRHGDEPRVAVVPGFVAGALRDHRRAQIAERLAAGPAWRDVDGLDDLVFRTPNGKPVWADQVRRVLARTCEKAGVPRYTPHSLRRAAASFLLARGVDLPTVMAVLGWRSAQVVLQVYAQAQAESRDLAAGVMDDLFGDRPT